MALGEMSLEQVAMHMHDTRGTALANVLVGLELGIRDFDAAVGGLGGHVVMSARDTRSRSWCHELD